MVSAKKHVPIVKKRTYMQSFNKISPQVLTAKATRLSVFFFCRCGLNDSTARLRLGPNRTIQAIEFFSGEQATKREEQGPDGADLGRGI
jgi:hypothetical protein